MTPTGQPLSDELVEAIAERFRVLGEPTRIKLLDRLRESDATVQELNTVIGTTPQNISKHLAVLQHAGLVARRKEGTHSVFRVVDGGIFELCELVCGSLAARVEALRLVVKGG